MLQYVNKLNVAINQQKSEIVLTFIQEYPTFEGIIDQDNHSISLKDEPVASIVVSKSFAKEIVKAITSMIENSEEEITSQES